MPNNDDFLKSSPDQAAVIDRIMRGFRRRTELSPEQEKQFQADVKRKKAGSPDDPTYDLRAAWLAGAIPDRSKDPTVHGTSQFKSLGDERVFLPIGPAGTVLDTRTSRPAWPGEPPGGPWTGPPLDPRLVALQRIISSAMINRRY